MKRHAVILSMLVLAAAAPAAQAQQAAPPRMLVPPELRPGEVEPDPGITVPDHVVPAPRGSGADSRLPPATSDRAVVPPGGGDPGILAPPAAPKPAEAAPRPAH